MAFRQRISNIVSKFRVAARSAPPPPISSGTPRPATFSFIKLVTPAALHSAFSATFKRLLPDHIYEYIKHKEVQPGKTKLEEVELVQHYSAEKTYLEIRFACHYKHVKELNEVKHYLESIGIHGLWKNKVVNGKKVPVNNPNYNMKKNDAQELLGSFKKEHPEVVSKMTKLWRSTNHTYDQESLWLREILKHSDSLSYSYWIKVMEIASEFFDEDGKCIFQKLMEEENFVEGSFNCDDFQKKISERFGKRVLTTFIAKAKGRPYPEEFGVFLDPCYTKIDHPEHNHKGRLFFLDGPQPQAVSSIMEFQAEEEEQQGAR